MSTPTARATVVVVTYDGAHLLPACLQGLARQTEPHELIVVDNASRDGTADVLARVAPAADVVRSGRNLGFAGGVNLGLERVTTEYSAVLNNDAVVEPDWLRELVRALDQHPEAASAQSKILLADPPATINSAGGVLLPGGWGADRGFREPDDGRWDAAGEIFYASAAAAAYRTSALRQVGLFDADFFLYYEDVDLGWRLRLAGWTARYVPSSVAVHQHSATAGSGSDLHRFHDDRNRLLCLVKNAPASVAVREVVRHPLTTASLEAKELRSAARERRRPRRAATALRRRAAFSFVRLLPRMLQRRRSAGLRASDRAATWRSAGSLASRTV